MLSNPVAWVKEPGAGRANSSDSAKPLHRHHRLIEFVSSLPKRWYKNYVFLRRYVTTTSQPQFFLFFTCYDEADGLCTNDDIIAADKDLPDPCLHQIDHGLI